MQIERGTAMWKPDERRRWQSVPGTVPTRAVCAQARLFSELSIGSIRIEQRTWVPAMVPWRAAEDGHVTDDVVAWYARLACGRPGGLVIEATGIRDVPSGPLLRIGDDRFIPGLARLVEAVREASGGQTRLFIQLIDFLSIRRRPDPVKFLGSYLTLTDQHRVKLGCNDLSDAEIRRRLLSLSSRKLAEVLSPREHEAMERGERERITDLDHPHVRQLPNILPGLFADAAERAQRAGFDGIELHYAHAYTMASFLSATNTRADGWGGCRENRVRLPLAVYRAVRERVGADHVVGCRFLADECIEDGSTVEDGIFFAEAFAHAGMDFLSLSRGGKFDDALQPAIGAAAYPYTGRSGYECMPHRLSDAGGPFGRNVADTGAIRAHLRANGLSTAVVCSGGVHNFEMAEQLLADGVCDIVGAARQSLADPDWWRKIQSGHGDAVRTCRFTNYCEGLDQKHRTVTCQLWDRMALDAPDARLDRDGRRRLEAPAWTPPPIAVTSPAQGSS